MNVLMFTHAMNRIGTWYRVLNLGSGLVRLGHSVRVVKLGLQRLAPRQTVEDGVSVLEVPRLWGSSLFDQATRMPQDIATRILLQTIHRYDVVHAFTHHLNALLPALIGSWIRRRTVVVGDRDDLWTEGGLMGRADGRPWLNRMSYRFHHWTELNMSRWLGNMTVVSEDLMRRVLQSGIDPSRVRKVMNGCPVDRIVPGDRAAARDALGLPQNRPIALFVGVGQYDVDMVLDALAVYRRLRPDAVRPVIMLAGPHADSMRDWATARGVADDVITTGFLRDDQLPRYLQAADVGLLPFADKPLNWARFPIKIGDYLSAGLPVLTNDVGEMGRIVREEDVGEVTASDPQAYAAGLARLLDDSRRLEAYRGRARAVAEKMSWSAMSRDLEQFYLSLSSATRSSA